MKYTISTTILMLVGIGLFMANSISAENNSGLDTSPKKLDRISPDDREEIVSQLSKQWSDTQGMLLTSLGSDDQTVQFSAAALLGLYRYAQAARSLADQITMEDVDSDQRIRSRLPRWGKYPAVEALVRVGKPSISAMLRNLETSDDEHVRGLSARVIYYVEGPELAKIVVKNAIAKQNDPTKKKRLETSLSLVRGGEYKKPDEG